MNGAQLFATNEAVTTNATGLAALSSRVGDTETDIVSLDGRVSANETDVSSLDSRVGSNAADITSLTGRVSSTESDLSALQDVALQYDDVTRTSATLGGVGEVTVTNVAAGGVAAGSTDAVNGSQLFATNQTVASLGTRLGQAEGDIAANATLIDGNRTDLDTVQVAVDGLDGRVTQSEADLADLDLRTAAAEDSLVELDGRVALNRGDIDALQANALQYDDATKQAITLGGATGTRLTNLAEGAVTAASSDAVTGSQLFATNENVSALGTRVAVNEGNIGANASAIADLRTATGSIELANDDFDERISRNEGDIAALDGRVSANETEIVGLDGRIATNEAGLADVDGRVTANTGAITTLDARVGSAETEIAALQDVTLQYDDVSKETVTLAGAAGTRIANVSAGAVTATSTDAVNGAQLFATDQRVAVIDGRVSQNEADIRANVAAIGDLQSNVGNIQVTVGEFDDRITKNEDDIVDIDGRVAVNEGAIADIVGRVAVNEGNIADLDGRVASNESDIADLDGRVATNAEDISALDTRVAANTSEIDSLDGRVTEAEGEISQIDARVAVAEDQIVDIDGRVASNSSSLESLQLQVSNVPVTYVSDADGRTTSSVTTNTAAFAGADGGAVRVTNVADGTLTSESTDAVNGRQLYATNLAVSQNASDIQTINNNLAGSTVVAVQYSDADNPNVSNGGTITNDVTLVGANASAPVRLHNVANAIASTDAVNLGQLQNGLSDVMASSMGYTDQRFGEAIAYTDARLAQIGFDLAELQEASFSGTAAAMAMASIPQAMDAGGSMIGGGVGHYRGQTAFGFGLSQAFGDGSGVLKVSGTIDTRGKGGVAAGAGFAF